VRHNVKCFGHIKKHYAYLDPKQVASHPKLISADTVDRSDMKPHWLEEIGAFTCRNCSIAALTSCSLSLLATGRTDIGL